MSEQKKEYPFKIGTLVKDNSAVFSYYRAQHLYYSIPFLMPGSANWKVYSFPVPIADIGEATFKAKEKAITLMRYVRKAMEDGTLVEIKPE